MLLNSISNCRKKNNPRKSFAGSILPRSLLPELDASLDFLNVAPGITGFHWHKKNSSIATIFYGNQSSFLTVLACRRRNFRNFVSLSVSSKMQLRKFWPRLVSSFFQTQPHQQLLCIQIIQTRVYVRGPIQTHPPPQPVLGSAAGLASIARSA